ncbi:MAG: glycosyltransferase, partial [Actinomycetes bacterium]
AEAMLCGLPIIATAEVGAIEAIDPRCVSVVPPASPEAMADAMEEILGRSSAQRAQIGALCRAEAIRLFNPAHITDLVEEALLGLALKQEAGR